MTERAPSKLWLRHSEPTRLPKVATLDRHTFRRTSCRERVDSLQLPLASSASLPPYPSAGLRLRSNQNAKHPHLDGYPVLTNISLTRGRKKPDLARKVAGAIQEIVRQLPTKPVAKPARL